MPSVMDKAHSKENTLCLWVHVGCAFSGQIGQINQPFAPRRHFVRHLAHHVIALRTHHVVFQPFQRKSAAEGGAKNRIGFPDSMTERMRSQIPIARILCAVCGNLSARPNIGNDNSFLYCAVSDALGGLVSRPENYRYAFLQARLFCRLCRDSSRRFRRLTTFGQLIFINPHAPHNVPCPVSSAYVKP